MSDQFLLNYAIGSLVAPGILVLSTAWLFIRTGHSLIWPVLIIIGSIVVWVASIMVPPMLLVQHDISRETFLFYQQVQGILLPLMVAFLAFKKWPEGRGDIGRGVME